MTKASNNSLLGPNAGSLKSESNATDPESKLSGEDLERVEKYLASPIHQVERKPFRPWLMMALLALTVLSLGGLSMLISRIVLG